MEITLEPLRCTKELILQKVSQEELMEFYVGVPVQRGLFRSPFRTDHRETVSYYKNKNGDLIYKDFGYPEHCGNFISVVMFKYNCSFAEAMNIIGNDFRILSRPDIVKHDAELEYTGSYLEETNDAIIQVEIRDFQDYELRWWKSFGITLDTLKKFKVYSCKNLWLNGNLFHLESTNQKIFGYYGGSRQGLERWRIYFPGKKKYKFLSNWKANQIQGTHMLPRDGGDLLIIQKSLKDVMLLYELGYTSIAPNSENTALPEEVINKLKSKFKYIIYWFDNDEAGIRSLESAKSKHPEFFYYYIPDLEFKDVSDYYKGNGRDKTKILVTNMLNNLCPEINAIVKDVEVPMN